MGLLLISGVVPTLQTARMGVDGDIANVLAGFRIMLSPDKQEVVRIVVYYMWCVEGEWKSQIAESATRWHERFWKFSFKCNWIQAEFLAISISRKLYNMLIICGRVNPIITSLKLCVCCIFFAVCYISAMTLSGLVNLAMLMRSMVLHRWVSERHSTSPLFLSIFVFSSKSFQYPCVCTASCSPH